MTIFIFGTVCIDRYRKIESFPKQLGTYTPVLNETIILGGEASNTFVCLIKWIDYIGGDRSIKLISTPFVNDVNGKTIMNLLKPYESNVVYTDIVDPSLSTNDSTTTTTTTIKYTPSTDIYVCDTKERTMFGIGFPEVDQYLIDCKQLNYKLLNESLQFGSDHWISVDANYPLITKEIIKKSILTNTNLYIMDQEIESSLNELLLELPSSLDKYTGNLIFQSSSDHFGNKDGNTEEFINIMNKWLSPVTSIVGKLKNVLLILTDSKNGFGISGHFNNQSIGLESSWIKPIPIKSEDIIDTTGAGDAFRAGLIYSLIYKKQSLSDSIQFASVSGGLNCCSMGGSTLTPTLSSINNLLKLNNKNTI